MYQEEKIMLSVMANKIIEMVETKKCLDDNSLTSFIDNYLKLREIANKWLNYIDVFESIIEKQIEEWELDNKVFIGDIKLLAEKLNRSLNEETNLR